MKVAKILAICAGLWFLTSCGKQDVSSAKAAPTDPSPKVQVTRVVAQKLAITVHLPGEIEPYELVAVFPKVTGFVKSITVDRGSRVKAGERIAQLEAPELIAQRSEAQSKLQAAQAQLAAAEAKVASDEGTYQHLKAAAATPGVVAGQRFIRGTKGFRRGPRPIEGPARQRQRRRAGASSSCTDGSV